MILATILAFVLAWPILVGVAALVIILALLYTEHEFISSAFVIALAALGIFLVAEAGHLGTSVTIGQITSYIGIYIAAGFAFTIPKWWLWAQKMGRKFTGQYEAWLSKEGERKQQWVNEKVSRGLSREEDRFIGYGAIQQDYDRLDAEVRAQVDAARAKRTLLTQQAETAYKVNDEEFITQWNGYYSKGVMKVRAGTDGQKWDVFYDKPTLVGYLTSWILNWPFYGALLVIEDFIAEAVNYFADHVGKTFRNIANKAFNASPV